MCSPPESAAPAGHASPPDLGAIVRRHGASDCAAHPVSLRQQQVLRALAKVFRGKLLAGLRRRFDRGDLGSDGALPALLHRLRQHDWVVYAKPPFAGPESVLRYLGRYTHRIALSNRRILRVEADQVTLRYRDYPDGSRTKVLTLSVHEFLRRFLLHVLPQGFVRIRHDGLLAGAAPAGSGSRAAANSWPPRLRRLQPPRRTSATSCFASPAST